MQPSTTRLLSVSIAAGVIWVLVPAVVVAQTSFGLPLDGLAADRVRVFGGTPNATINYSITHTNASVLGLSLSTTGPWTETLTVSVTLDSSGNGFSEIFYVLGEQLGTSQLNACEVGLTPPCGSSTQVNYTVVTVANVELIPLNSSTDLNPNAGGACAFFRIRCRRLIRWTENAYV